MIAARVLLLSTPLDATSARNGATCAVRELAEALGAEGLARPMVLVDGVDAPAGCEAIQVAKGAPLSALIAALRAGPELVHAVFAPRLTTGLALRAIAAATGAKVVQTIASRPRRWGLVRGALAGEVVVASSRATERALVDAGIDRARIALVPMPFSLPAAPIAAVDAPRDLVLFVGDYEFGDALDASVDAFAQLSTPRGVSPILAVAARSKTERTRAIEARLRARIEASPSLHGRVRILGEQPSLLPWIAAARCVILPARDTFAKLDHPRALLEAIALGTPVVVGPAASLSELVDGSSAGVVAVDVPALRDAIERTFEAPPIDRAFAAALITARAPVTIARAYGAIYRRLLARGRDAIT